MRRGEAEEAVISKLNPFLSYPGHDEPLQPWQHALIALVWRIKLATPVWLRRWVPDPFYRTDAVFTRLRRLRSWVRHPASELLRWRKYRVWRRNMAALREALSGSYPPVLKGEALVVEDLSSVMECVTFDARRIRLRP